MPNKKSAAKELRKTIKRTAANKRVSKTLKALVKDNLKKIKVADQKVSEDFRKTVQALDKAVKGVLKKNTASRKKSRLAKKINALKK